MLKILKQPKYALPLFVLLGLIVLNFDEIGARLSAVFESKRPPLLKLNGKTVEVTKYQYLGSWPLPDGKVRIGDAKGKGKGRGELSWRDAVRVNYDDARKVFSIDASESRLDGSILRQLTPDTEERIFRRVRWQDNQVSVFAFRVLSPQKQTAVVSIDTDNTIALYVNGRLAREVIAADAVDLGANLLIPVSLVAGENVVTAKVLSNEGSPRLRLGMILDQSKDAQAAWNRSWGFLTKLVYDEKEGTFETPVVRWESLLSRMSLGAEIHDVLNGKKLFKIDALRRGDVIKDSDKVLGEGIYKIIYQTPQTNQDALEEHFLVGDSTKIADAITSTIEELPWSDTEKLNVDAQVRRVKILFRRGNNELGNRKWEEKVLWTLGNLAEFINLKKKVTQAAKSAQGGLPEDRGGFGETALPTDIFKGMTGLRLGGFISKLDNSRQYYRLFTPSYHKAGDKLPMLVIMHPVMGVNPRQFLESPFMAAHREALHVSKYAEKHGFAVLWPGYRNAPVGLWTYESRHVLEAIEDMEKHHRIGIDSSRVSLYGTCAAGFYSSRLAAIWPNYFTAVVYDRAVFEGNPRRYGREDDSIGEWLRAISSTDRVIANKNLKIIVLNDDTRGARRGTMALSRQFLRQALAKRNDITHALGQRKTGVGLWDSIFEYLADCRNEKPDSLKVDIPAASGYTGPISEVFATPFIVVEGTRVGKEGASFMEKAVENLAEQYREQFFGANFILKKDIEITDEDIGKYSLVLVGNAESNAVWGRLVERHADSMTPYEPADDWSGTSADSAFAEVFRHPVNKGNYLLLIGSNELKNLVFLRNFNPFTACIDSYVYKYRDGREREYVIARKGRAVEIPNDQIPKKAEVIYR